MKKILFILALILITILALIAFSNYSTGYRAGLIMKMSERGIIMKTYEGQLNTGGFGGDGGSGDITSMIWDFSVHKTDKEVIAAIEQAVNHGRRVKLYYREKFIQIPFLGDTKYFVYKVEEIQGTH